MALKNCIAKAGKKLDKGDRDYMRGLIEQGRPDEEILNRLEQNITDEQAELINTVEGKGLTVKTATESDGVLGETRGVDDATASTQPVVEPKSSSESSGAEAIAEEEGRKGPSGRPEGEAKPSPKDASSDNLEFGPSASLDLTKEKRTGAPLFLTRKTANEAMALLAEGSPVIARFLEGKTGEIFLDAFTNSFMADLDVINLTGKEGGERLNLNDPKQLKRQREVLEHEIIHANTVGFMKFHLAMTEGHPGHDAIIKDIKYLGKAVVELANIKMSNLSPEAQARVQHITNQSDLETGVAELLAVLGAETAVSQEIMTELGRKQGLSERGLKQRIEAFLQHAKDFISAITDTDLRENVDIDKLAGAVLRTLEQGVEFREQQYQEARKYTAALEEEFQYGPKAGEVIFTRKASFDYLNHAVATMLNSRLERKGKQIMGNLHAIMYEKFPIYTDVADKAIKVYDESSHMQQFVHAVTGENVNKVKKADVLAKFAAINAQRTEIINDQVSKLTTLSKDLSDTEKANLEVFVSRMPLHDYFVLAGDLSTAADIEAEAELLRKELWKINPRAVRDVEQLIDWNIDGKPGTTIYNLDAKHPMNGEFGIKLRKLMALESIKRVGTKKFAKLLKNEELMDVIKDNSVANAVSTLDNHGTENVRDSLVSDYYKEPFQIKAVQEKDFRMYAFGEDTGWKVLKAPSKTELGIVYKPTIDSTDIAGAYTDMKLGSTDIDVGQNFKKFPGVVETRNGHKLLLTQEQKKELGLIEGFEQGLVRSTAHSVAIQESQIIRDQVLQDDTWVSIGSKRSINNLVDSINADNVDNPWFVQLQEGTEYSKLPQEIRAKYQPVGNRASNVKGFNEKVDLVRKDISHWLLGGSARSLFQNPQMKWATRILKNLVSGAKIGMIVLNPVKIANDNLSNLTYLGVLGLDPIFISKNYAEIQKDFAEFTELQRQVFQLKLRLVSRPESPKLQKQLRSLQKRIAANSVGDITDKGFVNSLGSDLVSRSADTLSGFQADMHRSLEYLLTDKAGNKNVVSHFIVQLQKIGYQAEDFFGYLGDIASRSKTTALLEQELDQVANRLREIKSEEDIVNYVAQFTTSPSSEAVRFGSAMTDLTDVLAKETLYRHFTQNQNLSPEDARIKVLDSFPDYKENMPLSVKALSDVGILMFPSFWLRIQKIIYRMARDKPIGLATEMLVQEALGSDVNTIFEANVINKSNTFGGLLHTPFEPVGLGSVVPTHVF